MGQRTPARHRSWKSSQRKSGPAIAPWSRTCASAVRRSSAGAVIWTWGWQLLDGSWFRLPRVAVESLAGENLEGAARPVDFDVRLQSLITQIGRDVRNFVELAQTVDEAQERVGRDAGRGQNLCRHVRGQLIAEPGRRNA